jgi:hypothetical protein
MKTSRQTNTEGAVFFKNVKVMEDIKDYYRLKLPILSNTSGGETCLLQCLTL